MKQLVRIQVVLVSVCLLVASVAGGESATQALLRQDWPVAATMAAADRSAFPPASVALLSGYAAFSKGGWFAAWESLSRLAQDDQKEELLKWAEGLLAGNQKSAVAWMIAGDARTRLGNYNEGVQALKCALDLDSSLILAIEIRALVHLFSGDGKAAEADFQEAAKRDPRLKDDATYGLAALSLQRGEYDNSIRSFTTLLEANPGHFLARNARAIAYSMLGDYRSAEDDFDRVLREMPSFRVSASNRELMRMARARGIFKMEQIMAMASPKGTLGSVVMVIGPRGAILDSAISIASRSLTNSVIVDDYRLAIDKRNQGHNVILRTEAPLEITAMVNPGATRIDQNLQGLSSMGIKPHLFAAGYEATEALGIMAGRIQGKTNTVTIFEPGMGQGYIPGDFTGREPLLSGLKSLNPNVVITQSRMQEPNIELFKKSGLNTVLSYGLPQSQGIGGSIGRMDAQISWIGMPPVFERAGKQDFEFSHPGGVRSRQSMTTDEFLNRTLTPPGGLRTDPLRTGSSLSGPPLGIQISFNPELVRERRGETVDPSFLRGDKAAADRAVKEIPIDGIMRFPFLLMNP